MVFLDAPGNPPISVITSATLIGVGPHGAVMLRDCSVCDDFVWTGRQIGLPLPAPVQRSIAAFRMSCGVCDFAEIIMPTASGRSASANCSAASVESGIV